MYYVMCGVATILCHLLISLSLSYFIMISATITGIFVLPNIIRFEFHIKALWH